MYQVIKTELEACIELIPHVFQDKRGVLVKPFHVPSLRKVGIIDDFKEDLIVTSKKNVIRGMHFQNSPFQQAKLIYCIKGRIIDVVIDLRKFSPTYGKYHCFYLDNLKNNLVYVPKGFAHGYGVLEDDTIVGYKMSDIYVCEADAGIRWNSIDIPWGIETPILSDKDRELPVLNIYNI